MSDAIGARHFPFVNSLISGSFRSSLLEGIEELVEIREQDFLTADRSAASVVTLYLSKEGNLAVKPKLMRELKPGARVVSYAFDMGDWAPKIAETYRDAAGDSHLLYFWQMSAPIASIDNSSVIP